MREGFDIARIVVDPAASVPAEAEAAASAVDQRYPWIIPRSTEDRPDEKSGRQIHFVYVVPSDAEDERLDEFGIIEDSARSMNHWMRQQTGDQQWRLDTFTFEWKDPDDEDAEPIEIEAVDVSYIKSNLPGSQLNSVAKLESELVNKGFRDSNKRYIVYSAASAGGVCGDAWYPVNPFGSDYARYSGVYLDSSPGCRARDFAPGPTQPYFTETIAMQEMIHNDGMVPLTAPKTCWVSLLAFGHVCTGPLWATDLDPQRFDVMYPYVGLPLGEKVLDEDRLDYYRHPFPYRDLEQGVFLEPAS